MSTHPIHTDTPHHVYEPLQRREVRNALARHKPENVPRLIESFVRFMFAAKAPSDEVKNSNGRVTVRFLAFQEGMRLRRFAGLPGRPYDEVQARVDKAIFETLMRVRGGGHFRSRRELSRHILSLLNELGLGEHRGKTRTLRSIEERVSRLLANIDVPNPLPRSPRGRRKELVPFTVRPMTHRTPSAADE